MSFDWMALFIGFVGGVWLGTSLTNLRWVANAKAIQRIECWGKLYKVEHDRLSEWDAERDKFMKDENSNPTTPQ